MKRVAAFHWRTPPPTSVDEELVLFDGGTARLLVLRPRAGESAVGAGACHPVDDDAAILAAAGPGPTEFDLLAPPTDAAAARLMAVADRVADAARATPLAVATFHARPLAPVADGRLAMSLLVVASGTAAVEFELDVAASAVHFSSAGQPVGWHDLPELPVGFVTRDAEGLGGVRRRARVDPGAFGAIAFDVAAPPGASAVALQVAGWLHEGLPDEPEPRRFEVRTAEAPIAS